MQEFAGGHIKGAVNVPSGVLSAEDKATLDDVIKEQLASAQEVVVHCQRSQVGPFAVRLLVLHGRVCAVAADGMCRASARLRQPGCGNLAGVSR